MRRSRITITLDNQTLEQIDSIIDKNTIRNRSHAIEFVLNKFLQSKVQTAVILAGGQGTKLRPYTYELPTPLLLVKGTPLLEHMIKQLKKSGITRIVLCIGYLGNKIKEHFGDGSKYGITIIYSEEKQPLQTGGALLKVKKLLNNEPFLVIHGDILTNLNFQDLINFHLKEGSLASVALTSVGEPTSFGQLQLHGTKLVGFFQNKDKAKVRSHLIHCGIYAFDPKIFAYFPKNKDSFSLEDVIEKLVGEAKVTGFVFEKQWFDVGSTENYERAIKEYKS